MKTPATFRSPLAQAMDTFVACKRMQGYDYTDQAWTLQCFDRFLTASGIEATAGCLSMEALQSYVAATSKLAASSRPIRLSAVREFSRFLHAQCPDSAILPVNVLPRHPRRVRLFPLSPDQIATLMAAGRPCCPPTACVLGA